MTAVNVIFMILIFAAFVTSVVLWVMAIYGAFTRTDLKENKWLWVALLLFFAFFLRPLLICFPLSLLCRETVFCKIPGILSARNDCAYSVFPICFLIVQLLCANIPILQLYVQSLIELISVHQIRILCYIRVRNPVP
jgi:hypothetical protein